MIWFVYTCFSVGRRQEKVIIDFLNKVRTDISGRTQKTPFRYDEISSKKELLASIKDIQKHGDEITEWHFVGYGMPYGPLLGKPEWPEEISAYEWAQLQIPFAKEAKAWFYMEGSDAWLAPFIATAFKITTYGCHRLAQTDLSGMRSYSPGFWNEAADYNPIAALYAEAFSDITVRRDEIRWIEEKVIRQKPEKVLDIGCGNGALLANLSAGIKQGIGADISETAIKIAIQNNRHLKNLSFSVLEGPRLPFADYTFDAIISLLSFRYLDWDPILEEMKRVLKPGGHILIVDMLASDPKFYEWPLILIDKLNNLWYLRKHQNYTKALRELVTHPAWRKMIDRHPMRLQDEFVLYLKSRFPVGKIKLLNTGVRAKILAFDSGPVTRSEDQ